MHATMDHICDLLTELIAQKKVEFIYKYNPECKYCVIDDMVLEFYEQEEGSFRVRYQGFDFLWMRETAGWEIVSKALSAVVPDSEDEDELHSILWKRIFKSLHHQLLVKVNGAPSTLPRPDVHERY